MKNLEEERARRQKDSTRFLEVKKELEEQYAQRLSLVLVPLKLAAAATAAAIAAATLPPHKPFAVMHS